MQIRYNAYTLFDCKKETILKHIVICREKTYNKYKKRNKKMSEAQNHNTIFDDVFRTMVQKMPKLLIPLINEVFHTDYSENESFKQIRNEHEEEFGKIITDSIIFIRDKTYHIECQSTDDTTMAIRMVEYDFAIALEQATKAGRMYEMDFPESCVLYLRCINTTPDVLKVKVNLPNGEYFIYETKVVKVQNYTKDAIFQKNLLFFLPYYIMRYEKSLKEISQDSDKLIALLKDYEDIRSRLEKELFKENKSVLYADLVNLIQKISDYILREEETIRKEVGDVMGGKVLELESERLFRIGKAEGRVEGKAEGKAEGEFNLGRLISLLFEAGRLEDAELAAKDEEIRQKFYKEFGIID